MGLIETYVNIKNYQDYEIAAYHLERAEANEVIQALEKQIPKKAKIEAAGEKTISGSCPRCEADMVYIIEGYKPSYKSYCRHCGQRVDWSAVIEKES